VCEWWKKKVELTQGLPVPPPLLRWGEGRAVELSAAREVLALWMGLGVGTKA
jgi:hypothetical protein